MFERFTKAARRAVLAAVQEAEEAQAPRVTREHLLLALLAAGTRSAPILAAAGVTRQVVTEAVAASSRRGGLTDAEAEALGELGIDVAAIVDKIEEAHGENALAIGPRRRFRYSMGHVPFTGEAKAVLTATLREAQEHGDRQIGDEHLLLALAAAPGPAAEVLAGHGLSYAEVRTRLARAS
jgi:ATP-dependent Clp protease ATP-binding subunit ClpA